MFCNEQLHLLLKSGERKTYAFENELNCSEFLNLARDCIGSRLFGKRMIDRGDCKRNKLLSVLYSRVCYRDNALLIK